MPDMMVVSYAKLHCRHVAVQLKGGACGTTGIGAGVDHHRHASANGAAALLTHII
jgi:hypothetical protein